MRGTTGGGPDKKDENKDADEKPRIMLHSWIIAG
jgi:hypothetical protein